MSGSRETLLAYLLERQALGDSEIFLASRERQDLLDRVRAVAGGAGTPAADLAHLSYSGSREDILAIPDLTSLKNVAQGCVRCALHATRTNVVFADGSGDARVLCVGEAPGANEDATGLPFVGRAGKLMDRLLLSVGLPRADVFICNVLKCRPPGNRNPLAEEIESCSPFMLRQIELVSPVVIVAFGTFAAQTLLETRESLGRLRGRTHLFRGYPLVVTYHPAALLRNPGWTRPTWEDLQLVRRVLDGEVVTAPTAEAVRSAAGTDPHHESHFGSTQLTLGGRDG